MSLLSSPTFNSWNAIFAPSAESASSVLSRWTQGRIRLELDEVREIGMDELSETLPGGGAPANLVTVGIAGELGGQMILVFDDESAAALVETLLHRAPPAIDAWGELEWSALKETGNLCASSFLSAIRSHASQTVMLPSPPEVTRDYVSCVLEQAVVPQLMENDSLLLCQTRMIREGEAIAFSSLFVPTPELVAALRCCLSSTDPRTSRGHA